MDVIKSMNGKIWIFASILIALVVVQAVLFLRLALNTNKKYNILSKSEINQALKTGAIATVGPAFSTLTIALSLIVLVGSATTFMRCGVIGAPMWELMMANFSAQAAGVEFGSPEFTQGIFTLCIFGMTFASAPYFISTIITLKPLDKAVNKSAKESAGKRSFLPYMSNAAMMGLLGYSILDYLSSAAATVAFVVAGVIMILLTNYCKKTNNNTLASFSMAIAMIAAMVIGQAWTMLIG